VVFHAGHRWVGEGAGSVVHIHEMALALAAEKKWRVVGKKSNQ
jgi:hypothetical protein